MHDFDRIRNKEGNWIFYIRQSSPGQVLKHQESTTLQYQMADRAREHGIPEHRIIIIDEDLGKSASQPNARIGFNRMQEMIRRGEVAIVFAYDVSRLVRNEVEWFELIYLCRVCGVLVADQYSVRDPQNVSDFLTLGVSGVLAASEGITIRERLADARNNKAARGELGHNLPVGYRKLPDGSVVQDSDEAVQEFINTVFQQFALSHNARAVMRYCHERGLQMPRYEQSGPSKGRLYWVRATAQMILLMLKNPVYAGMYVHGRTKKEQRADNPTQFYFRTIPVEEWNIIYDVYPRYISADKFFENQRILRNNSYNFTKNNDGAPREGTALLPGIIVCGRCGGRMKPHYNQKDMHYYTCCSAWKNYGDPYCYSFPVKFVDTAVSDAFFEAIKPAQMRVLVESLAALDQKQQERNEQWQIRLDQARYKADLCQSWCNAVPPQNYRVARIRIQELENALEHLEQLEQEYKKEQQQELLPLSSDEQELVLQLAANLPELWASATTSNASRKLLLRLCVEQIRLIPSPQPHNATVEIHWISGVVTSVNVDYPPMGWHMLTDPSTVELIRTLAETNTDTQTADHLNKEGIQTSTGKEWNSQRVRTIRRRNDIPAKCPTQPQGAMVRGDGMMSTKEAARRLEISPALVSLWVRRGILAAQQPTDSYLWLHLSDDEIQRLTGKSQADHLPSMHDMKKQRQCTQQDIWDQVRQGGLRPYRCRTDKKWQWRFEEIASKCEFFSS